MAAVSAWQLGRGRHLNVFRPSVKLGLVMTLIASIGVAVSGDIQARIMTDQQPMKMAAAEALYSTESSASFSLFTIGSLNGHKEIFSLRIPGLLSFLATTSFNGTVEGSTTSRLPTSHATGRATTFPTCRSPTGASG